MPSRLHQTLVRAIDERPSLLRDVLGDAVTPASGPLQPWTSDVTDHGASQLQPDSILAWGVHDGQPDGLVAVEVQLRPKAEKRRVWPSYVAGPWRRFGCPVTLVVVTLDIATARWAAQPIAMGPVHSFCPVVLGPDALPRRLNRVAARACPELALLSALAHVRSEHAADDARIALDAVATLPSDLAMLHSDTLIRALPSAARAALEEHMARTPRFEFQSDFFERHFGAALRVGRQEGLLEGREEGRAEGLLAGRRDDLLQILEARRIRVTAQARDRIAAEHNLRRLGTWLTRAAVADTLAEVFATRSRRPPTTAAATRRTSRR